MISSAVSSHAEAPNELFFQHSFNKLSFWTGIEFSESYSTFSMFIELFISKDEGQHDVITFMSIDKTRNDQSVHFLFASIF